MKWRIDYSREAEKFLKRPDVHVSVVEEMKKLGLQFHSNVPQNR